MLISIRDLSLIITDKRFHTSKMGLLDLLQRKTNEDEIRYPIIHLKGDDIEVALTHEISNTAKSIIVL